MEEKNVLSGLRPTGSLHLGHYVGVLKSYVELQNQYKCFFFIADWHAFNSYYDNCEIIKKSRYECLKGWLAVGVDPEKSTIYLQSKIPEVLYLNQVFLSLTPPGWADRSPSWKELQQNPNKKLNNLGFYSYPILQAADIAIVKGGLIPVGEDQISHIEISREIIRKFNRLYSLKWPEPEFLLSKSPKLLGIDDKKMSSSLHNEINFYETEKSLQKKIRKIRTDDKRTNINDPGDPDNCSIFSYHKIFSPTPLVNEINTNCRAAKLGCGDCKNILYDQISKILFPIKEKFLNIKESDCEEIFEEGSRKAQKITQENWNKIKNALNF